MQVLITHGRMARARVMQFGALQLLLAAATLVLGLMALSGAIYHFVFLKAVQEGWPVVGPLVQWVVRGEVAQRERFMRENLDAIAQKVGEMQAKLVRLEAMSERVSGLAGVKPEELGTHRPRAGSGGPFVAAGEPSLPQLQQTLAGLDEVADWQGELFAFSESRLFQARLDALRVPSSPPVPGVVGSGFGLRSDPFTGHSALHTGLDFPAEPGTPILAAAAGVVLTAGWHPEYGKLVELDHGQGLITRYAHGRALHVQAGEIVKRGQEIAEVGTTGRSTGPHLHFEVLLQGVPQNPARFLANAPAPLVAAHASAVRDPRRR
ncbi:MAG: M23 family metallopeptidase [Burkholderiales bacterium]|nr:M23 family metallopeptidase [Burkholderiales bacterium]